MQYQITSDNIEMSPSMEALAKEKMQKLENKLSNVNDGLKTFRIVINTVPVEQFEVKIHATVDGKEYFAAEKGYTTEYAMISAVESLDRMLMKDKVISSSEDWDEIRQAKRQDPIEE